MSRDLNLKFTPASVGDTYYKMNECMGCFKKPSGKKSFPVCSKCQEASFCSKECQKKAWPVHKTVCQMRKQTVAAMADAPSSHTFPPFAIRKRLLTDFIEVHECSFQSAFSSAMILEGGIDKFPFSVRGVVVLLKYRPDCNENPSVAFSVEGCAMLSNVQLEALFGKGIRAKGPLEDMLEKTLREHDAARNYRGQLRVFFKMEDHVVQEVYPQMHQPGAAGVIYRQHLATIDHSKWVSRVQQFVRDGLVMRANGENEMMMQLGKLTMEMKMKKGKWVWVPLTKAELAQHGYPPDFSGLLF
ncbi:hypothetical protein C8F04DRAFT_1402326 [Mycena alexandri]|uniref:MYND-type domain-containing protein n=1 Tax=Mycena alexandri TaxID=1745969 RepID=A0AAD6S812_9AGAR|nr:hypothetical protein C8F04DRAFT_1402326 [Mycena alexandri]